MWQDIGWKRVSDGWGKRQPQIASVCVCVCVCVVCVCVCVVFAEDTGQASLGDAYVTVNVPTYLRLTTFGYLACIVAAFNTSIAENTVLSSDMNRVHLTLLGGGSSGSCCKSV